MPTGNKYFDSLVSANNPVGEVIAVNKFLISVRGLQPCSVHSLVLFSDGSKGFVQQVNPDDVMVLHLGVVELNVGMIVVLEDNQLTAKVGKEFVGRVVSVMGEPLDGLGPIASEATWPIFNTAPPLYTRRLVEDQVESGVTAIDALFPIVKGQRMALIGDSKSGKSTLVTQLTINQKNTDQLVVYCLIAKRRTDVDTLLSRLKETDSLKKAVVVVSTMFESLIINYLAPYVASSIAEYFWQKLDQDTIVIYDDLTSHAHAYREIALLSGVSPGRDSYPGDMFYAHSSLLERAGRLDSTGKSLTSIPVVHAANGDITAYLPTNIMSITDGQWILDMETFRSGVRPALNIGLSVTRAGGVGHDDRQKKLASQTLKILADFRQAEEFSHFGSELAVEAKKALDIGHNIMELLTQAPNQTFSFLEQEMMMDIILNLAEGEMIDIAKMKDEVKKSSKMVNQDKDFESVRDQLKQTCLKSGPSGSSSKEEESHETAQ